MVIWLASFPRSGNSFFRMVSRTIFDQEIHSIYPEKNLPVSKQQLRDMKQSNEIFLVKTHELPKDSNPAIYLVRDGRDSLVSFAWFHLKSHEDANLNISKRKYTKQLKKEILSTTFGGWSRNCQAWITRSHQTTVVRFEDLIERPEEVVASALQAVDLDPERKANRTLWTFEDLHRFNPVLYRKGKVGDWADHMPDRLHDLFWKKHGEAMQLLDYKC